MIHATVSLIMRAWMVILGNTSFERASPFSVLIHCILTGEEADILNGFD
jgi:hypothetical protein